MSAQPPIRAMRLSAPSIRAMKGKTPIVALTSYTVWSARLFDPHVDLFIVGDSLGMVLYGLESTLPVTLDMMILHAQGVMRGSVNACVVVDMPFGSYQASKEQAFGSCARVMKETGCGAVKLEGGAEMAETIAFLVARGIPVMAHVGLMPQHVHALGGYRSRGRDATERKAIMNNALAVEKAGAFSVVLEGVEESLAREITARLEIPTIGIGASASCDGQVLVGEDMLGITERPPRFVKQYAALGEAVSKAAADYAREVRARKFPAAEHVFKKK